MIDEDELFRRLDAILAGGKYDSDVRRAASLSIGLCELLLDAMDDVQLEGLDAARLFWAGDETRYAHYLECFGKRIDADMGNSAANLRDKSISRLVWCTLVSNGGLSGLEGEFIVGVGIDAGLSPQQVAGVLAGCLPGFADDGKAR